MFITTKLRSLDDAKIETFIDDDPTYPIVTNFKFGASNITLYWTKEQYESFIAEGAQNLQELDSVK